ncbi:MAG: cysteine-rich KTR domain-containing protein [Lachnospiraceae bacterium]|nr:cysteine-rich KTR domain-containing protein [Lachnospiraceae bacterium]
MLNTEWVKCPICGNKTRNKIRKDTLLKNYPLFCPKCKNETLIEIQDMKVNIIEEPDAKMQSQ